ncbi:hypothetical protein IC575_024472 [Cucumis melo]
MQPYEGDCHVHRGCVMRVSSRCLKFPSHRQSKRRGPPWMPRFSIS